jgi:TRAP-type mannitol/chloroaromatic compound transport system substrate-binding protein
LTPAYKSVIRVASEMANTWMQAKFDALNPPALRRLIAGGAKLVAFPPAVMEACLDAALEQYHEVSEVNPDFKRIYKAMTDFRGDQYLWWQVAEYSNDTFMIRNRAKM